MKGVDLGLVDKMFQKNWAGQRAKGGPGPEEELVWGEALGGKY